MDETSNGFERATESAWREVRVALADRLAAAAGPGWPGLSLAVEGGGPAGAAAELWVGVVPEGVRADLAGLDAATASALASLGLEITAGSPVAGSSTVRATFTAPGGQVDLLAVTVVRALREALGVPHPAFLRGDSLRGLPGQESGGPAAVYPSDRDHLCRLVDEALTPVVGGSPRHDEDGDVVVSSGSSVLYVRVLERVPAVEVFCELVHGVEDRQRAEFEVNVLNRDLRFGRFVLDDDRVMVTLTLPAYPFAATHLREMLTMLTSSLDRLDDDLVRRVGGRRTLEGVGCPGADLDLGTVVDTQGDVGLESDTVADTEPVHPAMATLLQLEAEAGVGEEAGLTPAVVASVCGLDRALLLELISSSGQQQAGWRRAAAKARAEGRSREAAVDEREASRAGVRVVLLRRALRLVVEQQAGRDLAALGYGVVRSEPAERREGRARDTDPVLPGLPGLDPRDSDPGLWEG